MEYTIYQPAPVLRPFIDLYFKISGQLSQSEMITLLPEGGINLFVNLGEEIQCIGFEKDIKHEDVLLVGPMMKSGIQILQDRILAFGVRFKPGGLSHFFKHDSLDKSVNLFHEFPRKDFPDLNKTLLDFSSYLDQFFLNRFSPPRHSILNYVSDIYQNIGLVKVESLADRNCVTVRQLERQFKQQVGLSPKQFLDLERFRKAYNLLSSRSETSIADIVWQCGYYDHAHMTNDFKRFTGQPPTSFILSHFSKKIASESP
ncbi:MAG: AraC family transcriptional regulator [Cyclobacteriaceae bacterium]|nr:AraC family transcriptional regulator [Cyclobacteriaceae bacterium]